MSDDIRNEEDQSGTGNGDWRVILVICGAVVLIVAMFIGLIKGGSEEPRKIIGGVGDTITRGIKATGDEMRKSLSTVLDELSSKEQISVYAGNFFSDKRRQRFQFKERNLLLFFEIMRWRDKKDGKEKSQVSPYTIDIPKDVKLLQYSKAEAKGAFEITCYIDLANQEKWEYDWDLAARRLTITAPPFLPPNVGCNTPALTSALDIKVTIDCISLDEDTTKAMLEKAIPKLKKQAALRQLADVKEDARKSLKDYFTKLLPKMLKADKNEVNNINIEIKFKDEVEEKTSNKKW